MFKRGEDGYKNGLFTWFIGEVKDIADNSSGNGFRNRVRVMAYGYYDGVTDLNANDKTKTEEDWSDLPWATVMMPTTSASLKGVGGNHHLEVGSWVIGFFRDGPSAQDPIVIGSIATKTDGVYDLPTEALADPVNNKVYKSKAGHLIEINNKSDGETLSVTHAKGAKITIDKDNNLSITNSGTTNIESDGIITIKSLVKTKVI